MYRCFIREAPLELQVTGYSLLKLPCRLSYSSSVKGNDIDAEEIVAARKWLEGFDANTIPKSMCSVSFSRSSGAGGQHVNKTNSKATLRLPLKSLLPIVPKALHSQIQASRYYAAKSDSILIHAETSRRQPENVDSCFAKLHAVLVEAGKAVVPGETSEAQARRVKALQKADDRARMRMKSTQSKKKSARRGSSEPDY